MARDYSTHPMYPSYNTRQGSDQEFRLVWREQAASAEGFNHSGVMNTISQPTAEDLGSCFGWQKNPRVPVANHHLCRI